MLEKLKNHKSTLIGMESFQKFAVCIPLLPKESGYDVVFEVRSENIGRQPGDICFPGGRMEEGETPEEAVVRETAEELLIRKEQLDVLGLMDIYLTDTGNMIYPYAAILNNYEGTYSRQEVAKTFSVPLDFFLETEPEVYYTRLEVKPENDFPFERIRGGRKYPWRERKNAVYFYTYEEYVIWGMTARMMESFAQIYKGK